MPQQQPIDTNKAAAVLALEAELDELTAKLSNPPPTLPILEGPPLKQRTLNHADEFVTTADMYAWLNATPEGDRREVIRVVGELSIIWAVDRRPRTEKT